MYDTPVAYAFCIEKARIQLKEDEAECVERYLKAQLDKAEECIDELAHNRWPITGQPIFGGFPPSSPINGFPPGPGWPIWVPE